MIRCWIGLFLCVLLAACSLSKKVDTGAIAYQQKQYHKAVSLLNSEVQQISEDDPTYAEMAYLLGESYKYTNNTDSSLYWYIQASKKDYGVPAYWEMAYMLRKKQRYEDAILTYQRLLKMTTGRENDLKKEIDKCRKASRLLTVNLEREYSLDPLSVNSPESDYAPTLYRDEYLVFTSDRPYDSQKGDYQWTGNAFSDVFIHEIGTSGVAPFDEMNTDANEGSVVFSQDGATLFFTRCHSVSGDSYCRIMMAKADGTKWDKPFEPFYMKPGVNYGDPALIENDSVLILTSNDPTGLGGHDLYYSLLDDDGTWTTPELMPPYLNSVGEERFPTWRDGKLYYSSDHFPGAGGLDIFETTLGEDGSWSQPKNMGAPINSSEDDMSLVFLPSTAYGNDVYRQLCFASSRSVLGGDDIYMLTEFKTQEELDKENEPQEVTEEIAEEDTPEEVKKNLFLEIKVVEPLYAMPDNPNSYVVGKRAVQGASVRFVTPDRDDIFTTKENGTILLPVDTGIVYNAVAGMKGYLNARTDYSISEDYSNLEDGQLLQLELEINRIFEDVDIVMDDIYYDFNQSSIRDDAKPALDQLIQLMKNNPTISIQLSAHTDCRGEDDYNMNLSQERAQSVVDYVSQSGGVAADRMIARGYGESQPEIECACDDCTEDDHQINRRTTFRILSESK